MIEYKIHHIIELSEDTKRFVTSLAQSLEHNLGQKLTKIMAQLDDLKAQVARNTDVEKSAVTLLQGLKAQLDAAGTDPVALKALSDQLSANTDDLAAAVVANTPAT